MDIKLTMLSLLIGAIISLSHLSRENIERLKEEFDGQRWRDIVVRWRKL